MIYIVNIGSEMETHAFVICSSAKKKYFLLDKLTTDFFFLKYIKQVFWHIDRLFYDHSFTTYNMVS